MNKNKLMALILSVTMVFTMISSIAVVNAEGEVTEVTVIKGEEYSLPGGTSVDTGKAGYKIIEEDGITYRVNIAEFSSLKVTEDFESYDGTEVIDTDGWKTFSKGNSQLVLNQVSGVADDVSIATVDASKVFRVGSKQSNWTSRLQEIKNLTNGELYKFTFRHKLVMDENPLDPNTLMGVIRIQDYDSTGQVFSEILLYTNADCSEIYVRPQASDLDDAPDVVRERVKVADIDPETKATDWMQFEVEFLADGTHNLIIDGVQIIKGNGNKNKVISEDARPAAIAAVNHHPAGDESANGRSTYYFDDIKVYGLKHVTDTIENITATATVAQGDTAEQTAVVALNMSDGTTENFTVSYSADTSSAGSKTATGTIDGIDGTIPVSYKVAGIENKTLNTYIGADLSSVIPNADTSVFGRRYYKVAGEDVVTNYTVNTGEWGLKVSDNMSSHESATYTKADGVTSFETIKAANPDGFTLVVYNTDSENTSAVLAKDPDDAANTVVKFEDQVHSENLRWYLGDTFSGSFKVKMRLRFSDFTYTEQAYTLRVQIHNSENKVIERSFICLKADSSGAATGEYGLADYYNNGASANYVKAGNAALADGKYDTGWIDLEIIGNTETKTFDTYLGGKLIHSGYGLMESTATVCDISHIGISRRYSNEKNDSVVYVDDVEIYSHKLFTDDLPEGEEVLLGQNEASLNSDIDLTLSDGSIKKLPMTLEGVDSSKLGAVKAQGTITGFDDKVNVNVKVCNYDTVSIGYGNGSEYVTAPIGGGSIKDATFKNVGDIENAKAIFAWFDANNKLNNARLVDISGIAKGSSKKVDVGLELPADLTGGYLKVLVFDASNKLTPLDISHIEEDVQQVAPTVFMAGASTVSNFADDRFPEKGIGQQIVNFFDGLEVINLAKSGATTTSFIENGLWDSVIKQAKAGDYIFVSFGHNDQGEVTAADYKANLIKFITDAQAKSANVVMFTPIARRTEGQQGIAYDRFNGILDDEEYKGHLDDMKAVGAEYGVPVVDMTTIVSKYLQSISDAESIKHYMCDIYYSWDSVYKDIREWSEDDDFYSASYREGNYGKNDNTHCTQYGATKLAQMLLKNLKSSYPSINLNNYMINLEGEVNYPLGDITQ